MEVVGSLNFLLARRRRHQVQLHRVEGVAVRERGPEAIDAARGRRRRRVANRAAGATAECTAGDATAGTGVRGGAAAAAAAASASGGDAGAVFATRAAGAAAECATAGGNTGAGVGDGAAAASAAGAADAAGAAGAAARGGCGHHSLARNLSFNHGSGRWLR